MLNPNDITEAVNAGRSTRPRRRPSPRPQRIDASLEVPNRPPIGFFIDTMRRQDSRVEVGRSGSNLIHVSSLLDTQFCARKEWLLRTSGDSTVNRTGGAMRIVWALGRAAEHHARLQLLQELRHAAWGVWSCDCGRTRSAGHFDAEARCLTCESTLHNYLEKQVVFAGVTGSPDFIVRDSTGKLIVLEFKSIKKDAFELLSSPQPAHVRQAKFYVHLLHELGEEVDPRIRVIYVAKDYVHGGVYKEYLADAVDLQNPDANIRLAFQEAGRALQDTMPEMSSICQTGGAECTLARTCPVVGRCFAYQTPTE